MLEGDGDWDGAYALFLGVPTSGYLDSLYISVHTPRNLPTSEKMLMPEEGISPRGVGMGTAGID